VSRPLRGAVIGLGAMGRHHARILASTEGAQLVATCDPQLARAEEHARGGLAVASPEELPQDLDLAIVSAPTTLHRAIAEPLLRRGVACLIEKPIASSLADADALIAAAREGGAILAVGHAERFNPGILQVRDRIRRPLFIEAHRLGVFPDRSLDVDVVLDLMIHDLDLLFWLAGGELVDVHAVGVNVLTPRVDIANARLTLSTGCVANLTASRVSAEITRKLRVFQQDAYVSVDLPAQAAEIVTLGPGAGRPEIRREKMAPPEGAVKPEPLRLEQAALLAALRGDSATPGVTGEEGRRALDAALRVLAAMEAHAEWARRAG
jgi:predicted dehydrogenase